MKIKEEYDDLLLETRYVAFHDWASGMDATMLGYDQFMYDIVDAYPSLDLDTLSEEDKDALYYYYYDMIMLFNKLSKDFAKLVESYTEEYFKKPFFDIKTKVLSTIFYKRDAQKLTRDDFFKDKYKSYNDEEKNILFDTYTKWYDMVEGFKKDNSDTIDTPEFMDHKLM